MKFYYEGKTYDLTFERHHKTVKIHKQGNAHTIKSTYPYTTAKLYERKLGELPSVVLFRTVGCSHKDHYTNEKGRLYALKSLSEGLSKMKYPKGLIAAMWVAYKSRGKQPEQTGAVITSSPVLLPGLPPAQVH